LISKQKARYLLPGFFLYRLKLYYGVKIGHCFIKEGVEL
jgi:hypothetical protein